MQFGFFGIEFTGYGAYYEREKTWLAERGTAKERMTYQLSTKKGSGNRRGRACGNLSRVDYSASRDKLVTQNVGDPFKSHIDMIKVTKRPSKRRGRLG